MIVKMKYKKINLNYYPAIKVTFIGPKKTITKEILLDSGSTTTAISPELCKELDLEKIAVTPVATASKSELIELYRCKVVFMNDEYDGVVACCNFPKEHPFRNLLGRDIMNFYKIILDGPNKTIIIKKQ